MSALSHQSFLQFQSYVCSQPAKLFTIPVVCLLSTTEAFYHSSRTSGLSHQKFFHGCSPSISTRNSLISDDILYELKSSDDEFYFDSSNTDFDKESDNVCSENICSGDSDSYVVSVKRRIM